LLPKTPKPHELIINHAGQSTSSEQLTEERQPQLGAKEASVKKSLCPFFRAVSKRF